MQAKDVMTSKVITVAADTVVHDIVRALLKHRISAVPVVDESQQVVGMVSEGDLLGAPEGIDGARVWWLAALMYGGSLSFDELHGRTAREVMTRSVFSVEEDTSLAEIAKLLERKHIKRVPVLRGGALVGIVSRANLLHGLANEIIERHEPGATEDRAVRTRVVNALRHEALLDAKVINVTVKDGSIQLWGVIDNEAQHAAAQRAANNAAGERSVESNLGPGPVSGLPI